MPNPKATIDIFPGAGMLNPVIDINGNQVTAQNTRPPGIPTNHQPYNYLYFEIVPAFAELYKNQKDYQKILDAQTAGQGCWIQWGNNWWKIC